MEAYTDIVLDHVRNPRNAGMIEDATVVVQAGDPDCGDTLIFFIKIDGEVISDIKFLIKGCGAAIATTSIATELVMGKTLDEALLVTDDTIAEALGGLPPEKMHCSNMAAQALSAAVHQYRDMLEGRSEQITFDEGEHP